MSWLARSIANSLHLDDAEEDAMADEEKKTLDHTVRQLTPNDAVLREDLPRESKLSAEERQLSDSDGDASYDHDDDEDHGDDYDQGRGVKEDLSEFRDSLTRQLLGVASFLAPPPPPPPLPPPPFSHRSASSNIESKSDFAISGNADDEEDEELEKCDERDSSQFRDLPNFTSTEDYYTKILEDAIGITEEVLAFGRNIAHHPETWLDFPLSEEEDFDDFDISDAQYKHVLAIEHLAPRLAALRYELCPVHMSEGYFWMVYFVLLQSRLNKHDADDLSSPQLVQARAMWMQELQKRTKGESFGPGMNTFRYKDSTYSPREDFITHSYEDAHFKHESHWISPPELSMHQVIAQHEIEMHSVDEIEFIDKSVIKEDPPPKLQDKEIVVGSSIKLSVQDDSEDDDDEDDWVKDDSDLIGYTGTSIINEDDISFSDLEDDLDSTMPIKHKRLSTGRNTSTETT